VKYPRAAYAEVPFFDIGLEAEHYHQRLSKCRKEHKCGGYGQMIMPGDHAVNISAVFPHEGGWKNHYVCIDCMDRNIERKGGLHTLMMPVTTIGELLPLIRSQTFYPDEGTDIILAFECEAWTWVKINASNGLLDELEDLTVEAIDNEDGCILLWIRTDEECHPVRGGNEA
jgi:hypothetical protein